MKKKKELSEQEKQESAEIAKFNRRYSGFKRSLKTRASENGLRSIELQLEYLNNHPNAELPKKYFTHTQTLSAYKDAIHEYRESIGA